MNKIISENIPEINILCLSHNVDKLFAFGSITTDKFNVESDIDLLISFNPTVDYGKCADNYFD